MGEFFLPILWRLKARHRKAFYTGELPRQVIEAIAKVEMAARHDPLNEELD
jgi:hypothetical protein